MTAAADQHWMPTPASTDDLTLVSACLRGDTASFDLLVERHRRQVYRVCYRFVGNHEDASDLAQDAFIRAYRALGRFKGQSTFATWLHRIAVNVCLNHVASRRPAPANVAADERADRSMESADSRVLRLERAATVRAAIARLPKKQRATMILRVYHELPHDKIAQILGSSVGAVKANFFHALANLEKLLKEPGR